jgi:hypothetical protein
MNHLDLIDNKKEFIQSVKQQLDQSAFSKLEDMKREIANQILKPEE